MHSTRLLVSIRSVAEAQIALSCDVDLIDIKEPLRGALGACDEEIIASIVREVAARRPLSVALGELIDYAAERRSSSFDGVQFAKFGLAGMMRAPDWKSRLLEALIGLPSAVAPVAVIYADYARAAAPKPEAVIDVAITARFGALLVDTFCKDGTNLLDHCTLHELRDWSRQARQADMLFVIGGSVRCNMFAALLGCQPDFIAVRGAACKDSRASEIVAERIHELQRSLRSSTVLERGTRS
jgi:(5-formylfuran-3-yl)methyl phosphate synthase